MSTATEPPATARVPDYVRIERAIRFLETHRREQPGLDAVAAHVGLSPYHLQRVFKRWAGISPKRFLQAMTAEHARSLLLDDHDVLDAALETGLSGPGRLHDLLVHATALSPGETRRRGAGLVLEYGFLESPFGPALAAFTPRGLADLGFHDAPSDATARRVLRERWPGAELRRDERAVGRRARGLFGAGDRPPLDVRGTNFQIQVWRALLAVPEGRLATYADVARAAGRPSAVRAAGTAVGRNPVAWLIPCHRVIRSTGVVGDYHWGHERKVAMIAWETARADAAADGVR
jgi:AraC family transcriptional regulator of adaptative response/methylated-DNA-[protein]-cysteine methyltransferase